MIDFQLMTTGHPSRDFWYYLYTTTDALWRKNHLEEAFKVYYETFNPYLVKVGIQMTFEEMKAEFEKYRNYGFTVAIMALPSKENSCKIV